jgi:NADPH:quinone reductase-like Zn-dependent oxidoreductase
LIAVPARIVLPIPDSLSFEEAAAAPLVFLTAWSMLVGKGNLRPGEDILILGAGAGVGTAAIQIAKMTGCRVFATASTDEKLQRAKELGADFVIDYAKEEFDKKIRELTQKRGVDVVVDSWRLTPAACNRARRPVLTCGATTGFARKRTCVTFLQTVQVLGNDGNREFRCDECVFMAS